MPPRHDACRHFDILACFLLRFSLVVMGVYARDNTRLHTIGCRLAPLPCIQRLLATLLMRYFFAAAYYAAARALMPCATCAAGADG